MPKLSNLPKLRAPFNLIMTILKVVMSLWMQKISMFCAQQWNGPKLPGEMKLSKLKTLRSKD